MLTIQLSEEIERRLEIAARTTGRSASFHAERALAEYLDDCEAAERELTEVRAGRSVPVPLGELLKSHGLAD